MAKDYIERREGTFYLIGSRVPLARIVYEFRNGAAPETIRLDYSTLSLEQVYGAIAFYLGNKEEVEKDMAELQRIEEEIMKAHTNPPGLKQKLLERRGQMSARRS
jgi:uncharacterized protein (DUF433 family)